LLDPVFNNFLYGSNLFLLATCVCLLNNEIYIFCEVEHVSSLRFALSPVEFSGTDLLASYVSHLATSAND